jgi:phosphatidylglycerol---prolipoprotein diacylglyceryl transferase
MHWTHNLDPAIVHFGSIQIRWYGLMYVIGMVLSYLLLKNYFSKKGYLLVPREKIDDLITWSFVGLLLGARLFYIIFYNPKFYLSNPLEIFAFWHGGLSFHGGVAGIAVAMYFYAKKIKVPILNIGDHIAICGALGIGFGRIGNFINGELWGRVTTVPWAIIFPDAGKAPRHPSQLYESFFEGFLMFFILIFIRSKQKNHGTTLFSFLALYAIFRFFIEFVRQPDSQLGFIVFSLSMGQLLCIAMFVTAIFLWKINKRYA